MASRQHQQLMADLEASADGWGAEALLRCLQALSGGGPTQWRDVEVLDAWPISDGFCVVYEMYGARLGVRATRATGDGPPFFFSRDTYGGDPSPAEFGVEIADFGIAEPLGDRVHSLVRDDAGVSWWGDLPLPGT
jgi:hypothetical protein